MRLLLDLLLCVVLVFTVIPSEQASGVVVTSQGQGSSNTPRADCPGSCGNLTFDYPFGIGSNCFRSPDFSLTCDNTTQPPRLYLHDGTTEVVDDIDVSSGNTWLQISLSQAMPMTHGVSKYNMSWKAAGRAFNLYDADLNITGCDFDIYRIYQDTNASSVKLCTVTCPDPEITDKVAKQNCNGTGCCSVDLNILEAFQLQFVLHSHNRGELGTHKNRSSLWDSINVTSAYAEISWSIVDPPTCASVMDDRANYACVSNHSRCYDGSFGRLDLGYICSCDGGYGGNPYILNGCSRDKGNPCNQ
jgi:hypothetical protein